MKSRLFLVFSMLAVVSGSAAAPGDDYTAPRTEYGQPDFQGV